MRTLHTSVLAYELNSRRWSYFYSNFNHCESHINQRVCLSISKLKVAVIKRNVNNIKASRVYILPHYNSHA